MGIRQYEHANVTVDRIGQQRDRQTTLIPGLDEFLTIGIVRQGSPESIPQIDGRSLGRG
jgi:hypothetical protein